LGSGGRCRSAGGGGVGDHGCCSRGARPWCGEEAAAHRRPARKQRGRGTPVASAEAEEARRVSARRRARAVGVGS
jgi:hypothetical protein